MYVEYQVARCFDTQCTIQGGGGNVESVSRRSVAVNGEEDVWFVKNRYNIEVDAKSEKASTAERFELSRVAPLT